jgi:putative membrane-bound dehydrogenase-like protein
MNRHVVFTALVGLSLLVPGTWSQVAGTADEAAQKADPVPHGQDKMPGPALEPAEAIKQMTVPPGFSVELVAAEPDIVNPVAMTFDERGRIWITESLEYPRGSPGPGKDRIKVLESTKGDGHFDKITLFAEGLNIPSGIAVGHGGVWVANSPDILFYKEGADGKAAGKPEVVVTGFGRFDTHELPNSLTWGPDGYLYGLNGVFNQSHVKHKGKDYKFTCAMFRIHPRTKDFDIFCEGTSNPWGIAFDTEGSAFVSACVIDHLWHLTQTGYYHRQGGPYPPFTWKIGSIVKHKHQKAAYCGLCFFDSDAYPPEYREKLYMGNIHGGCINTDELTRDGSTYFAKPRPDFLAANDAWFMPVAQKVGPDGCMYILDWYDRYHCYQDAQRDPKGIDRQRGRLYRVRYKDSPRAGLFDLAKESDDKLIERLGNPNVYFRDTAQRLLIERLLSASAAGGPSATVDKLEKLVLDPKVPRKARMHALWTLVGAGRLAPDFHLRLVFHEDSAVRAWAVRAAGNMGKVDEGVLCKLIALTHDKSPDVKLQWAIAARKVEKIDPLSTLLDVLREAGDDKLIPHIVWQNLHPLLETQSDKFLERLKADGLNPNLAGLMPRVVDRLLAAPKVDPGIIGSLLKAVAEKSPPVNAQQLMATLAAKVQAGEIQGKQLASLKAGLQSFLRQTLQGMSDAPLFLDAALLAVTVKDPAGYGPVRQLFLAGNRPEAQRVQALEALIAGADPGVEDLVTGILADAKAQPASFRGLVVTTLGRSEGAWVATLLLERYPTLEQEIQSRAIEVLTQRPAWSKALLAQIAAKKLPAAVLNTTQIRKLQNSKDTTVAELVKKHVGTVREDRNPEREKVVGAMRKLLSEKRGDAVAGVAVFKKNCAVCHKMYGEGQDVGPDITVNGRSDFEQLLSDVFDPNLVIGSGYQATTVTTNNGQILSGLLVEDNQQRVVLKIQGGELKTVARGDIESVKLTKVSLMPEQLEKQMTVEEIRDLFAYLTLDHPPGDPKAKLIPGTPK